MNIYAKITENDEHGDYITPAGTRVVLEWGHLIKSPTGETPEQLGYTEFPSLEDAIAYWKLEEISYPRGQENDENDLTTTE